MFGPCLLSVTLLNQLSLILPAVLVAIAIGLIAARRRAFAQLQWTEILFIPKRNVPAKVPVITNLYANLMVSVIVSILAVDFNCYPERLAKTSIYGFSLMDVGAAAFVATNGIISAEARFGTTSISGSKMQLFKKSLMSCIPVLVLGLQRLLLTKSVDYTVSVNEYGVHWNFFFTLAFTRLFATCFFIFRPRRLSTIKFALSLLLVHQLALKLGLAKYIQNDKNRGDSIIAANKDGIISLLGYVALYLIFVEIGNHIYKNR